LEIPLGWQVELVVVDNGSSDETPQVAAAGRVGRQPASVVIVERPGVARARNRGAAMGTGEVLLFLDDDVQPPPHWLEELARPILDGRAAAAVSLFRMSETNEREWMTDADRGALVSETSIDPERPWLASGSMAIARSAFELCGCFEEELGPGALGAGGEDLLLTYRLHAAGLTVACVPSVVAEHAVQETKLSHDALVGRAAAEARSEAWLAYHWFGRRDRFPWLKALVLRLALLLTSLRRPERTLGFKSREAALARGIAWHRQMAIEQRRAPKFAGRL
jgi:glycosyltransferase involved in cell wall biosynthesis